MQYFLLFLVAFDPQVPMLPSGVGFTLLVSLIFLPIAIFKSFKIRNDFNFIRECFPFLILFIFSLFFIVLRIIFNQGYNYEFYLSWVKAFFVFIACFSILIVFFSKKDSRSFICSVIFIYTLNSIFNYVVASYPEFFGFLNVFKSSSTSKSLLVGNPYRNSFISGSGYFSIGTAYGLIVLLLSLYIVQSKSKNILLSISTVFIAITGFVAARTAFFAIAPALFYIFKSRIIYFIFIVVAAVCALYLLLELPALQQYKMWMLSFFSARDDASGSHLIEQMYFWPSNSIVLFGMGVVNDGTYTYTDSGYMQDILFGGVFFLAIKLLFLAVLVFKFFKKYPVFITLASFAILAFHFKGAFLYNNAQGMAAFYFIYFYLCKVETELPSSNVKA